MSDYDRKVMQDEVPKKVTREALLQELRNYEHVSDAEAAHRFADLYLLSYIDDEEITEAFLKVPRWYS